MNKNDILTGVIKDLTVNGEGVARVDGFPFFIKDTVIGDEVEFVVTRLKKTYGYGHARKIIFPSEDRVAPPCPIHRRCGGCSLQSMSYEAQLRFKEKKVYNNLLRLGEVPEAILQTAAEPILPSEKQFRYRNKAQFPFGNDRSGRPICGFYAARSHEIVPCTDCMLGQSVNKDILETILSFMEKYNVAGYDETKRAGVIRHVLIRSSSDCSEHMVCIVINEEHLPKADVLIGELARIPGVASISCNINTEATNVILGDKTVLLWGKDTITDTIEIDIPLVFEISPHSFFQVNPKQTGRLYSIALDYANLTGGELVWDLYCGIGTISLFAAKRAGLVIGVESIPQAIDDAKRNANRNGIENVEFICGTTEDTIPRLLMRRDLPSPDVIIVDPPRKGCAPSCLDTILTASPEHIVYVSCDSATLARDIKMLRAGGYELRRFRAVDQFCQGVHVEVVVMLSRAEGEERAL